jgi:hypothetical protein
MLVAVEFEYRGIVNEYAQFFKDNLKEKSKMNSSWMVVVAYRDEFEGTYGRNETLPNRIITRDSGFYSDSHHCSWHTLSGLMGLRS